jgi:hypothetical protein
MWAAPTKYKVLGIIAETKATEEKTTNRKTLYNTEY